jgi:hypothetical protein
MIESVDLVLAALSAGAAAGVTTTASTAVTDAYAGVKSLTRKALRRNDPDLDEQLANPEAHGAELRAALTAAEPTEELVAAARSLLALTKYQVDIKDSKGIQVGDHNTMTLNFDK